jgi:hypothetical protein
MAVTAEARTSRSHRGRAQRLVIGLAVLAVLAVGSSPPAGAQAPGIGFLSERQLQVSAAPGERATASVQNRTAKRVRIRLYIQDVPRSVLRVVGPPSKLVAPRRVVDFRLEVQPGAEPSEGTLVAVASDGRIARRPVRVGLPYPPQIPLSGEDWLPLLPVGTQVRPALLPEVAGPDAVRTIGSLSGPDGVRATVKRDRGTVWVDGVLTAGRYTGAVDLTPGAGGGQATVTLAVRHAILYPLVVLLLVGAVVILKEWNWLRTHGIVPSLLLTVVVALAGLLVLYVPNTRFGSAFDYFGVALWAAVVGGSVRLGRRLLARPAREAAWADFREAYQQAAGFLVTTASKITAEQWDANWRGAWTVRQLVGRASRVMLRVERDLESSPPEENLTTPVAYLEKVIATPYDESSVPEAVETAATALGERPADELAAIDKKVSDRLARVRDDQLVNTPFGGIRLDRYLPAATFQLVVHTLDLAAAIGSDDSPPAGSLTTAMDLGTRLAQQRGRAQILLLGMVGREPLPPEFSVLADAGPSAS